MGSSPSRIDCGHIVIVGGGYAGANLAYQLKDRADITIISDTSYFFHKLAALRASVEKGFAKKITIPLKDIFGDKLKVGKVTGIDTNTKTISLENGESVKYDVLVLATGSNGVLPCQTEPKTTPEEVHTVYDTYVDKVAAARNIVIVGGGPVGVEMAGELGTDFKDKSITLIHANDNLVSPHYTAKNRKDVQKILEQMGVTVILGDKVTNLEQLNKDGATTVETSGGKQIPTDLVIPCIGLTTRRDAYESSLGDKMDSFGRLKVDEYFNVIGCEDVFAIGDCCNTDEPKMALNGMEHAKCIVANFANKTSGKPLKKYNAGFIMMGISIGRNVGFGQKGTSSTIPGFIIKMLKSRDLMTGKTWSDFGLKQPK
ncbi:unnamed protein product [Owenia fusiformis]|uniref:Ferroptosis suppressor protein 1 n=1 Tax=Owenia fusiformis TaxID=6347 RepID=A0A8S4PI99_OWEFU|nr:unnamed protein product [Owenia fusiformis]